MKTIFLGVINQIKIELRRIYNISRDFEHKNSQNLSK